MLKPIFKYFFVNKRSITSFLTVGLLSALVYFGAFTLCWKVLKFSYPNALSISYLLSIICHFTANRYYTFQSHGQLFLQHFFRYLVMIGINYLITLAIVWAMVEKLGYSPYLGIVASIATTMNIGYLLARYWVFQKTGPYLGV